MAECKCGCGTQMSGLDSRGRAVSFIFGHGCRGVKRPGMKHSGQFQKGFNPWNKGMTGYENKGTFKIGHEGMKGEKSPNWRGGSQLERTGYLSIRFNGIKVYLHRHLMEQKLDRKLYRSEHVHHINHDKLDNRIENLILINANEHSSYHANVMWGNLAKGGI